MEVACFPPPPFVLSTSLSVTRYFLVCLALSCSPKDSGRSVGPHAFFPSPCQLLVCVCAFPLYSHTLIFMLSIVLSSCFSSCLLSHTVSHTHTHALHSPVPLLSPNPCQFCWYVLGEQLLLWRMPPSSLSPLAAVVPSLPLSLKASASAFCPFSPSLCHLATFLHLSPLDTGVATCLSSYLSVFPLRKCRIKNAVSSKHSLLCFVGPCCLCSCQNWQTYSRELYIRAEIR